MYLIDSNRYRRRIIGSPVREGKHWLESSRSHLASVESGGSISCPGSIKSTSMMNRGDPNCRDGTSTHPSSRDLRPKAQHGQAGYRGRVVGIAGSGLCQSVDSQSREILRICIESWLSFATSSKW